MPLISLSIWLYFTESVLLELLSSGLFRRCILNPSLILIYLSIWLCFNESYPIGNTLILPNLRLDY